MSITERIRYGAEELKTAYNQNLALALVISVGIHVAAIALYVTTVETAVASRVSSPRDTIITIIEDFEVKDDILPRVAPPRTGDPLREGGGGKPTQSSSSIGKPVIIPPDATPSDKPFATMDELPHVGGNSGEVTDSGGRGGEGNGPVNGSGDRGPSANAGSNIVEPLDLTADFYDNVEFPGVDMADIAARIEYPRMARDNGIEGTVIVKALVGANGKPDRVEVLSSSNRILDRAALDAVQATTFTPAKQNGQALPVWIQIPIKFQLGD